MLIIKKIIVGYFISFGILSISEAEGDYPRRIISLSPPLTENLYLLGVGDRLVGVTTYCQRPKEVEKKEKVGSCINANLEKILSLTPDLVLASSLTNPNQIQKLRELGIKVVIFPTPKSFTSLCDRFLQLSKIVGKEKKGEKIVRKAKRKVEILVKETTKIEKKPSVFVQVGAKPLYTATKESFINDFIEFGGGVNIAKDANTGLYNLEEVLQKNPEIIIIVTMGIVGEEEKKNWEKYDTLAAVKNKRIYIMDAYKLCSPTPVSFPNTLEEIIKIFHE